MVYSLSLQGDTDRNKASVNGKPHAKTHLPHGISFTESFRRISIFQQDDARSRRYLFAIILRKYKRATKRIKNELHFLWRASPKGNAHCKIMRLLHLRK